MILLPIPKRFGPAFAVLLALLSPAGAGAYHTGDLDHGPQSAGDPVVQGTSLSGRYLAGRHAQANRDFPAATRYLGQALTLAPDTLALMRRMFVMLVSEGRIGESAPLAEKILLQNPKAPIAVLAVIVEDLRHRRFQAAAAKIAALPQGGLNTYMSPMLAAWTAVGLGESPDVVLGKLAPLEKDGSRPLYFLHKALLEDRLGSSDAALATYRQAIEEQGGVSLRVVQLLGNLHERRGEKEKAAALYREFAETDPRSMVIRDALRRLEVEGPPEPLIGGAEEGAAEGFYGIATTLSQQNARETAMMFARLGLHLRDDFPVMEILLGNILQGDDQLESANRVYGGINPSSSLFWAARLQVAENQDQLGQTDKAVKTLKAMAKERPERADPLIRLGDILRARERFKEAVSAYDEAIARSGELTRHHWTLLYARGIVLERSRQWDKAEADFLKALEFEPDQPFVLNYLGYSWVDQGRHLDRAKEMIRRAVDLRPNDGYIVDSLGWAHFRLGEFDIAVKEMERAVELRPEDPILNDHLGDALWRVGRRVEARYQWQRVLTLEPEDDLRDEVRRKLADGLPPLPEKGD